MLRFVTTILVASSLCTACSTMNQTSNGTQNSSREYQLIDGISGAKAGFAVNRILNTQPGYRSNKKPSSMHGIFVSSFLSQNAFYAVTSAINGIQNQMHLIAGQKAINTQEVYGLMTDYGAALQVDVPDMLNRSTNREKALDVYVSTLKNLTVLIERKIEEMKTSGDNLTQERKAAKSDVSTLEKEIKKAFDEKQFEEAALKQEILAEKSGTLASLDISIKQNKDMLERFNKLLQIGTDRQNAIDVNRRILISGLTVTNVPGIEEFKLIETP